MAPSAACMLFFLLLGSTVAQPPAGELPDYARVTPSMAIIIVVLIAALFLMGFFSIYIRNCSESQSAAGGGSIRQLGRRAVAASRGLDPSVIETFPTMVYSAVKGLKIGKGALECAVCLNEFDDDETLRLIPKCDHVFHPECIDAWLESHTTCPVCRANLTPDGEPTESAAAAAAEPMAPPPLARASSDLEAGTVEAAAVVEPEERPNGEAAGPPEPVVWVDRVLNRNRTRGSRSGRPRKFPRSHSTGHSLVQPGENTDRFTLRLPADVRKQVMRQRLGRSSSMVLLPREGSTRRGYRTGGEGGGGSSRGKRLSYKRLEPLETEEAGRTSDRWGFNRTSSFFARASSFLTRTTSSSVRSPRVAANDGSVRVGGREEGEESSVRPPV